VSVCLGIYDGHNAAAALAVDGRVIHAVQEERLARVKNFFGPPERAAAQVLELAGLTPADVDRVCLASQYVQTPRDPRSVAQAFEANYEFQLRRRTARWLGSRAAYRRLRAGQRMDERRQVVAGWGFDAERVTFYSHHRTHATSAYFGLRRDDEAYLVVTLDGGGDGLSGSVWRAEGGELEQLATMDQRDSLGEIYAATTHLLGFMPLEHEYKLMGMAPYAEESYAQRAAEVFSRYLDLDPNSLCLRRRVPEPLTRIGPRLQRDLERQRFDTICAGLQLFTEQVMTRWIAAWVERAGVRRVLAAGGVFMNVKANKAVSELDEVEWFEAFPSCGDESLALGAAWRGALEAGDQPLPLEHLYLGSSPAEEDCRGAADIAGLAVERPADMAARVAELLAEGEIVARAAGPMEFGARALGNRSILADPVNQDVVRVINQMIKKRDFWMPFAPVALRRRADAYFDNPKGLTSPYMMNTFDSTDRRGEFMAAVHNADLTARPQLVEDGQNPPYEAILERFGALTGRHVLLNTSFNLHGYPIVCSPSEAVVVLQQSGLRRLVVGPLLVSKQD